MPYFIDKLRHLIIEFPSAQNNTQPLIFIFESLILTDQKLYADALNHLNQKLDEITLGITNLTFGTQASMALQTAIVYFWNREFKMALKVIRPVLNAGKPFNQLPQTKPVRFLNILIHCELGDHDYLESEIRSVERDLRKRGKLLKSEEIIFKSVLTILNETDTRKRNKKLQKQKEILLGLKDDPFERQLLNSFDYVTWLETQLK
jgi:hypothetical protein